MCTRPITVRLPPSPYERAQGISSDKVVQVPCGKCPECLRKRQNDIAVRAYREAKKYNSCFFVTLTYAPEYVPFAQTLLDVDLDTGEVVIDKCAEICASSILDTVRNEYHNAEAGVFYKYQDICRFEGHLYQVVYTPSLYYEDVKLKIKNFRVKYQREFDIKPDFSYICVGEYGHKRSRRPHYHILFFGLSRFQVDYFTNMWHYGKSYTEAVKWKNEDGSDGLAKVASYIGKYAAKGNFNPSSVINHLTVPCRVSSSRGFGTSSIESLSRYYRGYDIVGNYDIEKLDFDYDKDKLYDILFNRLKYNFNGYEISLPISLLRKIFNYRLVQGQGCWSALYYEIMDFARNRYQNLLDRQFREFCAENSNRTLAENCVQFESIRKSALANREKSQRDNLAKFYSQSKF